MVEPVPEKEALVIAHLGQGIAIEYENKIYLCQPLRRLETVAVGDRVLWSASGPGQGRIDAILPRRSLLARPSRNNKIRPVAANIDRVFIVVAAEPLCDFLLVDQYLAVCESSGISATIIANKADLAQPEQMTRELDIYRSLNYPVHSISTYDRKGMDDLKAALANQTSVLAGQSGVGKSSIVNQLVPDKQLRTKAISANTKLGRHTTTTATLYHLNNGGDLIDSPGAAIFGLADMNQQQLAQGYREFWDLTSECQFNDCRHQQDKGCAVRKAAEEERISSARYQRYLKLRQKMGM